MEPADDNSGGHSTSRHQPNPQILSHDQIFRAQVGETLVLPCQVAALGKNFFISKNAFENLVKSQDSLTFQVEI